ncbi:ubiquitin carboxyl-terminal hydrolase 28 isoform X9 [Hemicordylus capensis]|uniref:ubiquitin carboxyl-terminal hydrolase 28 isoform X9 n=1 Tax=Hemicordylus capensis TaxID=884348 RepID=UPI00230258EB|nr:ubiquitin carboxyl-terminal hydrolase 28 isoform X9 [Hemicordylus capensis]
MTAELQQAAPEGGAAERQARNCNVLINQLREITGIQDPLFLHETLKAVDGDLVQAVGFLTEGHATELGQEVTAAEPSDCQGCAAGQRQATSPVDATPSDEADLQKAVSLKVQDLPDVEAMEEDPDATAKVAHEASMAESKSRSKRKRCEVWGENAVQNEWRRGGEWPVGMKNVGNTCWFSAVIQSLFQLPEFRQLVLNYSVPNSVLENCQSHSKKRSITFMQELQLLFALMLGTCRKSVDPSTAVELLRGAFRPSEEQQQQDVSEITHKLLDWMEDAFQLTVNVNSSSQDKSENPMVQLFYGTFLTEGIHEGNTFSIIETFGQYPLQVNGYKNLHECLEGAMVEGETELLPSNQPVNYGQERWFTKLPPVLTFELSRFEFNQSLGQPEKIHNKLEFPQIIYMDRFLYSNKELIQAKREELKKLKDQETVLQQKLERYMKYGSGTGHFPLPDMLQYVLEFASTKPSTAPPCSQASEPTDPQAEGRTSDVPPTESRVVVMQTTEHAGDAASAPASSHQELVSKPRQSSSFPVEMLEYPAPHVITQDEMSLVMTCLQRWRDEVEQDIKELKSSIALLGQSVEQMYSDPQLHQVPYHLHAVLVHEGQANAGHYWAYIYNQPRKSWLKYNDLSVTESSWEELERDSFGGLRNASAYCLMYRNERLPHLAAVGGDAAADDEQAQREVESLTWELQKYIRDDNHRFEQEVADKEEEEQSCKVAQVEQSLASAEEAPCSPDSGQDQSPPSDPEARSLSSEHAMITRDQTAQAIAKTADVYEKSGAEVAFKKAFREEYSRLHLLSRESPTPQNDPRLQHVLIYFLQNNAPQQVVERTLLEQFADKNLSFDGRSISIMQVAQAKLKEIRPDEMDMEEYQRWHEDYSLFRKVSVYLLTGLELYQNEKYCEALTYLVHAYQSNMFLLMEGPNRGVDESLVALYRRKCLLKLNDAAAVRFESGDELNVAEVVNCMNEIIIPCMHLILNNNISQDDLDAIEVLRRHWCNYVGKEDMNEDLHLKLHEFLPRLLDCGGSSSAEEVVLKEPPKIRPNSPYDLCSRFAAVMESIHGASAVTVK